MHLSSVHIALAWLALHGLAACAKGGNSGDRATETICTMELRSSLAVEIYDERGRLNDPTGVTVVVRGPTFRDSVVLTRDVSDLTAQYMVFEDRAGPGDYDVSVRRPGYRPWERRGVRIRGDACHVTAPASLKAVLEPLGR